MCVCVCVCVCGLPATAQEGKGGGEDSGASLPQTEQTTKRGQVCCACSCSADDSLAWDCSWAHSILRQDENRLAPLLLLLLSPGSVSEAERRKCGARREKNKGGGGAVVFGARSQRKCLVWSLGAMLKCFLMVMLAHPPVLSLPAGGGRRAKDCSCRCWLQRGGGEGPRRAWRGNGRRGR